MSISFTTLPLEVRNQIYGGVFSCISRHPTSPVTPRPIKSCFDPVPDRNDALNCKGYAQEVLALLLVNRQISDESAMYFYAKTTFRAEEWHMIHFLRGVGSRRRNSITSMEIVYDWLLEDAPIEQSIFDLLCTMHSLRTVRCECSEQLDFPLLQRFLIHSGILQLTGKANISVHNIYDHETMVQESSDDAPIRSLVRDLHVWSCAEDATEWKEMEPERIVCAHWSNGYERWIYLLPC